VPASLREGDDERGRVGASADTPGTLHVVGGAGRHVAQQDGLDLTDVDAELERGRAAEHVDLTAGEVVLDRAGFRGDPLSGVLLDRHADRLKLAVQTCVVAVGETLRIVDRSPC
jgi:hypothetical protein